MTKTKDDWQPTELEYLRADVHALQLKLERIQSAAHKALMLHANGEPDAGVRALQEGTRQLLGEHATDYWMRESADAKTEHFETWAARERAIAKLVACGVKGIEVAELRARCCMPTEWRPVPARVKRTKRVK